MSTSKLPVRLSTDNPFADILLLNSRFRIIARGPSPLETEVPPGVYSMKVKVGDEETEELFSVRPGDQPPLQRHLPAPTFSSPIPLANTSTTHEYHQAAAAKFLGANAPTIWRGGGSSLMLCVRDPSKLNFEIGDADRDAYAKAFCGFRLLDAAGSLLVDFDKEAEHNAKEGYMAARVDLKPGSYALAHDCAGEQLCVALPTAVGWTLQAYLHVLPSTTEKAVARPDFRDAAFAFTRAWQGFMPDDIGLRAIETVRKGLLEGRNYVDTDSMNQMLSGKFENPMLGLLAGHLLLLESPLNARLLGTVIQNTAGMLAVNYPDVVALAWAYSRATRQSPGPAFQDFKALLSELSGPPLLSRSWTYLVDAARQIDRSLLKTSAAYRVAGNLVSQGVYLSWRSAVVFPGENEQPRDQAPIPAPVSEKAGASGGIHESLAGLAKQAAELPFRMLKAMRGKVTPSVAGPPPVAAIEAIENAEQAAAVLRWLAMSYEWQRILPQIKSNRRFVVELSGVQKDLFWILRSVSADKEALESLTPDFVEKLLEAHQIPLETLARALSDIEAGGYLSDKIKNFVTPTTSTVIR